MFKPLARTIPVAALGLSIAACDASEPSAQGAQNSASEGAQQKVLRLSLDMQESSLFESRTVRRTSAHSTSTRVFKKSQIAGPRKVGRPDLAPALMHFSLPPV